MSSKKYTLAVAGIGLIIGSVAAPALAVEPSVIAGAPEIDTYHCDGELSVSFRLRYDSPSVAGWTFQGQVAENGGRWQSLDFAGGLSQRGSDLVACVPDSNRAAGINYTYRVRALPPGATHAAWSQVATEKAYFEAPSKPRNLRIRRSGDGTLRVTWDRPEYTGGVPMKDVHFKMRAAARYQIGRPRPLLKLTCEDGKRLCFVHGTGGYRYRVILELRNGHGTSDTATSRWVRL